MLLNGPIAEAIAGRYRARGIESDDLLQVAYLGLVKASQGYRAAEGPGFLAHVEIAESLGVTVGEFREVEMAAGSYNALSLDAPDHEATGPCLADLLVDDSEDFEHVEARELLRPALAHLSEGDRRILLLRFVREFTQEQIGDEIGVSQMQVSRLLTRILRGLADELVDDHPEAVLRSGA